MPADPKLLLERYSRLLTRRKNHETVWEQIADVMMPQRTGIISRRTPGEKRTTKQFDGTAIRSSVLLASTLQSTLWPSGLHTFSIKYRDKALNDDKATQDWTEDTVRRKNEAITQSTFDLHDMETKLDLVVFGICCMLCEEEREGAKFRGLRFQSIPVGDFVVDENGAGQVDTVGRCITITARAARDKWGEKAITQQMRDMLAKEPEKPFTIIHFVTPRPEEEQKGRFRNMPWMSAYIEVSSKALIGKEAGYHEMPFFTPRWGKATGEMYGYGPGHQALPDVQTVNRADEMFLKSWAKAIDPPTQSRWNGVVGSIKSYPGGNTVVRDINDYKENPSQARFDVHAAGTADKRQAIREAFFVDQLALKESPQMTALEVQVRFELMQRVLGPTLGRLRGEYYNPMIERVFGIMARAGALLPIPQRVRDYVREVGQFDIEYEGPMARSQRSPELVAIERSYALGNAIATIYPPVFDLIDHDDVYRNVWKITGAPQSSLRGKEQIELLRNQRKQQQDATMALQVAGGAAEAGGKVAPLVKAVGELGRNGGFVPAEEAR